MTIAQVEQVLGPPDRDNLLGFLPGTVIWLNDDDAYELLQRTNGDGSWEVRCWDAHSSGADVTATFRHRRLVEASIFLPPDGPTGERESWYVP